jgi:hypothetical protein
LPPELVDNTQLALLIKTLDLELVNTCEHSWTRVNKCLQPFTTR